MRVRIIYGEGGVVTQVRASLLPLQKFVFGCGWRKINAELWILDWFLLECSFLSMMTFLCPSRTREGEASYSSFGDVRI